MRAAQSVSYAVVTAVIVFGMMLPALGAPAPERLSLGARMHISEGQSVVVAMQGQAAIFIIGPIDSTVLASYRTMQSKSAATKLYIDSGGGDIPSAIALADDLRKRGMLLIVAGKCFSACANYIFAGALRKDVLPGSLIGIHSSQLQYYSSNGVISMPQRRAQQMAKFDLNGSIKKQLGEIAKLEQDFYARNGLSKKNLQVFDDYQLRLEQSAGKNYSGCRKIDMWILSKNELQQMGISGMHGIWMPETAQEAGVLSKDLGLDPANVFFGSQQQLDQACTRRAAPVMTAKRHR